MSADGQRDPWNVPRLRRWARRAPLIGVFSEARPVEWPNVVLVSLDVRGAYGRILNMRTALTGTGDRGLAQVRRWMLERVVKECGQPVALHPDPHPLAQPPKPT